MGKTFIILITVSLLFSNCKQDQPCDNSFSTLITNQFQSDSSLTVAYRNQKHLHFQKILKLFCGKLNGKTRILLMDQTFAGAANKRGLLYIYDDKAIYTYDYTRGNYKIAQRFKYDVGIFKAMLNAYKDSPIEKITKAKENRHLLLDAPHYAIFYVDLKKDKLNYWLL